jgi:predicted DCC family thiol-disulfide oxidoreductase YuxK
MAADPVVMFDGKCNFCDGAVHFVLDHEDGSRLKFAAIQSDAAAELLETTAGEARASELRAGATGDGDPSSVILVEDGNVYTDSTASLRIARYMRRPWRWMVVFTVVPRPIRDLVYRWFARNRYRWFGKTETCRVPTAALRARFLA